MPLSKRSKLRGRVRRRLRRCKNCGTTRDVRRKYCGHCSQMASAIYNRRLRRRLKAQGKKYWLIFWRRAYGRQATKKRREYQRNYMREYRKRNRRA